MPAADQILQIARSEYEKSRWLSASQSMRELSVDQLSSDDLERLAICAAMTGDRVQFDDYMELAFEAHNENGSIRAAARCAFWLGFEMMRRGEHGRGGGWLGRVSQLLDNVHEDCPERGFLLVPAGLRAFGEGDPAKGYELFKSAQEIGARHADPDLRALGTLGRCQAEVETGRTQQAIPALDGLMLDVLSPDVSPIVVGIVYCAAVEMCRELFEVGRAQEWTDALNSWCDSQEGLVMFRGQCLVYRSELLQFQGAWQEAAAQAALARERLSTPAGDPAVGAAYYQIGELCRLRGDYPEAETNFRIASEHGRNPEPGMALLSSAQGRHDDALGAIRRALTEKHSLDNRIRLLLAGVEVFLDAGELEEAESALTELTEQYSDSASSLLLALTNRMTAAVLLARNMPEEALARAREAERLLARYSSPYERARVKSLLSHACSRLGDDMTAEIERSVARKIFEELGATPEIVKLETGRPGISDSEVKGALTRREVEVTRLVAAGMTNRSIADELVLSEKTVARHLSNIFTKLDISSRAALTAYAYEQGLARPTPSA